MEGAAALCPKRSPVPAGPRSSVHPIPSGVEARYRREMHFYVRASAASVATAASLAGAVKADGERGALTALTVLGAILTIGGLLWGARRLIKEYEDLRDRFATMKSIEASSLPDEEKRAQMTATMPPSSSWNDISYMREWIRFRVIEQARENLKAPAAFTLVGVAASTAASVWSLYI